MIVYMKKELKKKNELRGKIREILESYDTIFGRDSRFIGAKMEENGYRSPSFNSISRNCVEMKDVISVGTHGTHVREKWRLEEEIGERDG